MKRVVLPLLLTLLSCAGASADTVYFKKGTKLDCKVVGYTAEGLLVLLGSEGKGSIVLDAASIDHIDYDYDSRLREIEAEETKHGRKLYGRRYELAAWCVEQSAYDGEMYDRALAQLLEAAGKPGVPVEAWLLLGKVYEKCSKPDLAAALAAYKQYLALHPDSVEAAAAAARLRQETEPITVTTTAPVTLGKEEGLETLAWNWEKWSNDGVAGGIVDSANGGTSALKLTYDPGTKFKAAYSCDYTQNLTAKKAVTFDAYNPGTAPVSVAVAVVTGEYEWFESVTKIVPPGKWELDIRFDLTEKIWKSEATNWRANSCAPRNLDAPKKLYMLVYNGNAKGVVYLDRIKFSDN